MAPFYADVVPSFEVDQKTFRSAPVYSNEHVHSETMSVPTAEVLGTSVSPSYEEKLREWVYRKLGGMIHMKGLYGFPADSFYPIYRAPRQDGNFVVDDDDVGWPLVLHVDNLLVGGTDLCRRRMKHAEEAGVVKYRRRAT